METPRTVGVEEELLLIDPETRTISPRSTQVIRAHEDRTGTPMAASDELDQELFLHQVETRTDPSASLDDIEAQLVAGRRTAGTAAEASGLAVVASGIVPMGGAEPQVSPNDRYRNMVDTFGETARTGQTCGCHVHVAIDSPAEGVGVIDRITPWLPVLVAIAANSPYFEGRDTNYASWRSQAWTRWPSAGATEAFGSVESYEETSRLLKMTGAARDDGMLYYDARLSKGQPTVEVRVLDVCTDLADTVLCAALVRGLAQTAADAWAASEPLDRWRAEILRASSWRAAHVGLAGTLVHPLLRELRPAREVVDALVQHVRPALEASGDLDRVVEGAERVLRAGGATRQRAAYERTGAVEGVVDDLITRTDSTWR
ncbi:carboxylate-amine ligase [Nocardioides sp. Iso805N]|uniref:carboxylate-amine ligase n=1 Tax=Nocardioides sp. Iso805N TaxID=1283287 RepID=UPI0003823A9E|nr:glutamate--cysteine ligase [Nocardioides sp. Iso805N]